MGGTLGRFVRQRVGVWLVWAGTTTEMDQQSSKTFSADGSAENIAEDAPTGGELEDAETDCHVHIENGGRRDGGRCRQRRRGEGGKEV